MRSEYASESSVISTLYTMHTLVIGSVVKRPTDSTTSTTSG